MKSYSTICAMPSCEGKAIGSSLYCVGCLTARLDDEDLAKKLANCPRFLRDMGIGGSDCTLPAGDF